MARSSAGSRVTVTVASLVPVSAMLRVDSSSVTAGGGSSSSMASVRSAGSVTPRAFDAVPAMITDRSGRSRLSSTAVMVTSPVLARAPAAIDSTRLALSAKS